MIATIRILSLLFVFLSLVLIPSNLRAEGPMPTHPPMPPPVIPPQDSPPCFPSQTVKLHYGSAGDILQMDEDQIINFCPVPICRVSRGRISISGRTNSLQVDNSGKVYLIWDGNTLMPAGNQAQAQVTRENSGTIRVAASAQVVDSLVLKSGCTNTFESGSLQLNFAASGIVTATYTIGTAFSGRYAFVSVGGETSNRIQYGTDASTILADPEPLIDVSGMTLPEVNAKLRVMAEASSAILMQHVIEDVNEYFKRNDVQVRSIAIRTWSSYWGAWLGTDTDWNPYDPNDNPFGTPY